MRYHSEVTYAQVTYEVVDDYPALATIKHVTSRIEEQGWKPVDHDPAGNATYPSHKWSARREAIGNSPYSVDQWMGWYKDKNDNFLQVAFRYTYPISSTRTNQLFVVLHAQVDRSEKTHR